MTSLLNKTKYNNKVKMNKEESYLKMNNINNNLIYKMNKLIN
jgi:hypothetical protein